MLKPVNTVVMSHFLDLFPRMQEPTLAHNEMFNLKNGVCRQAHIMMSFHETDLHQLYL